MLEKIVLYFTERERKKRISHIHDSHVCILHMLNRVRRIWELHEMKEKNASVYITENSNESEIDSKVTTFFFGFHSQFKFFIVDIRLPIRYTHFIRCLLFDGE